MFKRSVFVLFLLLIPVTARSQSSQGLFGLYGFYGLGSRTDTSQSSVQFGFGGDASINARFRVGAELGYVGARDKVFNGGLGTLSANIYYVLPGNRSWTPFVTGGYTFFTAIFAGASGLNAGAGTDIALWKQMGLGLRLEFRDQIGWNISYNSRTDHFPSVRFGPVLRLD
jgi:hypothetical protein